MFDMGLEQIDTDDLIGELRKRFSSMVFAGLEHDERDTHYYMGGTKLTCVGLASTLAQHAMNVDVE